MRRLILALTVLALAGPTRAEMPALLQDAMQKLRAEKGRWAYTETSVTRDSRGRVQKETVVRHDPSLPYAEQSRMLKINGREPTKLEARRHREAAEKSRNSKRVTMDDQVDLDHVTVAEETPTSVTYDIPLRNIEGARFPANQADRFRVTITVNRERRVLEHVAVQLRQPLYRGPLKLSALALDLTFATVDPKYGPVLLGGRGTGTGGILFLKTDVSNERTCTDFQHVTPYDERFGVKIGKLKVLDFW
jgi:hypothetical protein